MLCLQEGRESMQRMNAKECLLGDEYPVMPRTPKDLVVARPNLMSRAKSILCCHALPRTYLNLPPQPRRNLCPLKQPARCLDPRRSQSMSKKAVKGPGGRGRGRGRGRGQGRGKPVAVDNEDDNDGEVGLDNDGDDER